MTAPAGLAAVRGIRDRTSPLRSVESERVLLAAVLGDGTRPTTFEIDADDLTGERHADLWGVLLEREDAAEPFDALTLHREIEDADLRALIRDAMAELGLPSSHVLYHAKRVRRLAGRRRVAEACAALVAAVEDPRADFDVHVQTVGEVIAAWQRSAS